MIRESEFLFQIIAKMEDFKVKSELRCLGGGSRSPSDSFINVSVFK